MKLLRDLIGDDGDALCVRVVVAFKLVGRLCELDERIRRSFVDQFSCLHGDHGMSILANLAANPRLRLMIATGHALFDYSDRSRWRAPPRLSRAASVRDLDTTAPASLDI